MLCEYGHGRCTAPDTICPHWQGIVCELDQTLAQLAFNDIPKLTRTLLLQNEETVIKTIKEEDVFN